MSVRFGGKSGTGNYRLSGLRRKANENSFQEAEKAKKASRGKT